MIFFLFVVCYWTDLGDLKVTVYFVQDVLHDNMLIQRKTAHAGTVQSERNIHPQMISIIIALKGK